jgi:short subunit dehydrogenase-like uncharacterized protein
MDAGWFRCKFMARSADGSIRWGAVSSQGDPANRVTVLCVCEAALTLASERDDLPDRAGVLTPSTGLGVALQRRLQSAGMQFETL